MVDFITIGSISALLATYLKERGTGKQAKTAKNIMEFQEWLRRNEHAQVVSMLESQHALCIGVTEAIKEVQKQSSIDTESIQALLEKNFRELRGFGWLSKTAPTHRIDTSLPLIGRDRELKELESRIGEDTVVVGQPGSGKTFLLESFAHNNNADFVLPNGAGLLRDELQLARPQNLIIDDCGDKRNIITELIDLRERDTEMNYRIIAICWPSEKESVTQWLSRSSNAVLEIEPLLRDQMVEVVKAAGIHEPNSIIRMIVNQSMNKPGLAVTLSRIALDQGVRDVWEGTTLYTAIRDWFEPRIGAQATAVLAAFAFGGDMGMNMTTVEKWADVSRIDLGRMLKELATGGVIHEVLNRHLSVQPEALRFALLKNHFFDGATSHDPTELMAATYDRNSLAKSLIGVKRIGGTVDDSEIRNLLNEIGPNKFYFSVQTDSWVDYAYLGPPEAKYIFDTAPNYLILDNSPFLHHIPDIAIPKLIDAVVQKENWKESLDHSTIDSLRHWIESTPPEDGAVMSRRLQLAKSSLDWMRQNKSNDAGVAVLVLAFTPEFHSSETDPGRGRTVTIISGSLGIELIDELGTIWDTAVTSLDSIQFAYWKPLLMMIRRWAYPGQYLKRDPQNEQERAVLKKISEATTNVCRRMVRDVAQIADKHPGVHHELAQLPTKAIGNTLLHTDEVFELLYFKSGYGDGYKELNTTNENKVRALADEWSHESPNTIASRLDRLTKLATEAGIRSEANWFWVLSDGIAGKVENLSEWLKATLNTYCSEQFIGPLLTEAIRRQCNDKDELIISALDNESAFGVGIQAALRDPQPSAQLLARLEATLSNKPDSQFGFMMRDAPLATVLHLLGSSAAHIAGSAAIGEWYRNSQHEIRKDVHDLWEDAVIRGVEDDHLISQICEQFPSIGYKWIKARLQVDGFEWYRFDTLLGVASKSLASAERIELLKETCERRSPQNVIHALVRLDAVVYEEFLSSHEAGSPCLAPLGRYELQDFEMNDQNWVKTARVALNHGAKSDEIAHQCLHPLGAFSDNKDIWKHRIRWYKNLTSDEHDGVKEVGRIGMELAERQLDAVIREERNEALQGIR